MNYRVFYFSGTGNSLAVAEALVQRLGAGILEAMAQYEKKKEILIADENVVIVCPVYFFEVPGLVSRFVQKMKCTGGVRVSALLTCGGDGGYALYQLDETLRSRGLKLDAGMYVPVAENSILIQTSQEKRARFREIADKAIDLMSRSILQGNSVEYQDDYTLKKRFWNAAMKAGMKYIYRSDHKSCDRTQCNQCGLCEKVCPVNNIEMQEGFPRWGKSCEQCFACINWCHKSAVRFGRINASGRQYRHPDIKVTRIINQKGVIE